MTTIRINVRDQVLSLLTAPIVTTNGHNENKVVFKFSKEWEGLNKTAVFFHEPEHKYNVVLVNDEALIPNEVLTKSGLLNISVFGEGGNEGLRKTTNKLKYKIIEGTPLDGVEAVDWQAFKAAVISAINEKIDGVKLTGNATTAEIVSAITSIEDPNIVKSTIIETLNQAAAYINIQSEDGYDEYPVVASPLTLLNANMTDGQLSTAIDGNFHKMGNMTKYYRGLMIALADMEDVLFRESTLYLDSDVDMRPTAQHILAGLNELHDNYIQLGLALDEVYGNITSEENDPYSDVDEEVIFTLDSASPNYESFSNIRSRLIEGQNAINCCNGIVRDLYNLYTGNDGNTQDNNSDE